jgi:hypothetical protein
MCLGVFIELEIKKALNDLTIFECAFKIAECLFFSEAYPRYLWMMLQV